ncbi:MAG: iron-sulfur cluster assembly scaffold protein [Clostridiales bacterium]|jgi:nitrogen fixation NifU-like protein|nr:iron-sulfur cluster assembly scaffold protein [Clostridiales bacterium]
MYTDKVMENFQNPQNVGEAENANAKYTVGSPECGDIMEMTMRIEDNIIKDVKFRTFGCAAAIASSSMATQMLKGKTVEDALKLKNTEVIAALGGLPPQKIHCSVLAEEAIKGAIENYLKGGV